MKIFVVFSIMASSLLLNIAYAKDSLVDELEPLQRPTQVEDHMPWHSFRHELTSYPRVNASISHDGVVSLHGLVGSPAESEELEALASRIIGATKVVNETGTK